MPKSHVLDMHSSFLETPRTHLTVIDAPPLWESNIDGSNLRPNRLVSHGPQLIFHGRELSQFVLSLVVTRIVRRFVCQPGMLQTL